MLDYKTYYTKWKNFFPVYLHCPDHSSSFFFQKYPFILFLSNRIERSPAQSSFPNTYLFPYIFFYASFLDRDGLVSSIAFMSFYSSERWGSRSLSVMVLRCIMYKFLEQNSTEYRSYFILSRFWDVHILIYLLVCSHAKCNLLWYYFSLCYICCQLNIT